MSSRSTPSSDARRTTSFPGAGEEKAAVRAAKNLIGHTFTGDQAAGLAAEVASFGAAFAVPDQSEGMRAFVEKRSADFAGD